MGRIAEALRSNLRELAQADARLLRELDGTLPADDLDALTAKELKQRCRQRGLRGTSTLRKHELIARLRAEGVVPGTATGPASDTMQALSLQTPVTKPGNDLVALEERLDRMEALLGRIAAHLGVA